MDKALRLRREDRWQKCEEWKAALNAPKKDEKPKPRPEPEKSKAGQVIVTLALVVLVGAAVKHWTPKPVDNGGLKFPTPGYTPGKISLASGNAEISAGLHVSEIHPFRYARCLTHPACFHFPAPDICLHSASGVADATRHPSYAVCQSSLSED